ncbi:MAG: hypothetical protein KGL95_16115 [Patescibacteria group bacterium]|nr:hypothetical protein [Patescibacteria group bacterium]
MFSQVLILLGIFINGVGTASYVVGTVRGNIKPNKVTFFVWSLAPLVAFFAQIHKGVGIQSWMTLSVGIFPLSVFTASFINKKSHWKLYPRDVVCGLLSVCGLVLWYLTHEPNVAIVLSLFSEGFATLPTIIKSYYYPETEIGWPWLASVVSGVLTLITISIWNFATYSFPLFYTAEMIIIFLLVQFRLGNRLLKR